MKITFFLTALLLTAAVCVSSQTPVQDSVTTPPAVSADKGSSAKTLPQQTGYVRPDSKTRFRRYLLNMFGPEALATTVVSAGINTWTNSPKEWGKHWDGFGRRVASSTGTRIISNTVRYTLEESFKLDSRFFRSQKETRSRILNALISPVTARNEEGKRVFGFPRIIGTYTGQIIAKETWYPARYSYKDGLKSGTISLGTTALFNLVRELIKK